MVLYTLYLEKNYYRKNFNYNYIAQNSKKIKKHQKIPSNSPQNNHNIEFRVIVDL